VIAVKTLKADAAILVIEHPKRIHVISDDAKLVAPWVVEAIKRGGCKLLLDPRKPSKDELDAAPPQDKGKE